MNEDQKLEKSLFVLLIAVLLSIVFCLVAVFTIQENQSRIDHINSETPLKY